MGLSAVLACASFFVNTPAEAAQGIPYRINFQGRLTDNNGNILANGSYNIKFRIFDAATSGTNLWEADRVYGASDHRVVVTNGLFSIQLGDTTSGDPALSPTIFNTASLRYLEIELPSTVTNTCATNGCASFTEGAFTPRHVIGASPYAFVADTLDGLDSGDFGQVASANTFTATNTFSKSGGAGIVLSGTPASSGSLLQVGSALSSGNSSGTLIGANGAFAGDLLNLQVSNATKLRVDNSGNLTLASGAGITIGAAAGSSTTCSGGQFLQNQTTAGGIVTGGTCATPAGTGANTTLSNLGVTSINADLLPSANNARVIGSASAVWSNVYAALVDAGTTTTTLGVGTANATAITVGKSGTTTTFNGPVTLASGQNLTITSGTITATSTAATGNSNSFANSSMAPAAAAIASLISGTFTAGSTNATSTATTNGLAITPTVATSGAGAKAINGVAVGAPSITSCTSGACTIDGLKVTTLTAGAASTITSQGVDIQASGISAGTLTGVNISGITPGAGTETALSVGSGWDNIFDLNGTLLSSTELGLLDGKTSQLIDSNDLTSGDGSGATASGSGLESGTGGIGLIQGCSDGQILKWNDAAAEWECGSDRGTSHNILDGDYTNATTTFTDVDNNSDATDKLGFNIGANEEWVFFIDNELLSNATADQKWKVNAPAGATCDVSVANVEQTVSVSNLACGTSSGAIAADTATNNVFITGSIRNGATSGTVVAQYGQSSASGTSTIFAGSYINAYRVDGADLAEAYYTEQSGMKPGTLASLDPAFEAGVKKPESIYDDHLLGVVSTKPGKVLGEKQPDGRGSPVMIALAGRVPVRVSSENGVISPGDYLTSSSTPGVAMKATEPGYAIAQALTGYSGDGEGLVAGFIKPGWYMPPRASVKDLQNGSLSAGTISNLRVGGLLTVTGDAVFNGKVSVNDIEINGHLTVGADTAGTITIPSGSKSAEVKFRRPYKTAPKVTTSVSDYLIVKVENKTSSGFQVSIPSIQKRDVFIDWTAVEVRPPGPD